MKSHVVFDCVMYVFHYLDQPPLKENIQLKILCYKTIINIGEMIHCQKLDSNYVWNYDWDELLKTCKFIIDNCYVYLQPKHYNEEIAYFILYASYIWVQLCSDILKNSSEACLKFIQSLNYIRQKPSEISFFSEFIFESIFSIVGSKCCQSIIELFLMLVFNTRPTF